MPVPLPEPCNRKLGIFDLPMNFQSGSDFFYRENLLIIGHSLTEGNICEKFSACQYNPAFTFHLTGTLDDKVQCSSNFEHGLCPGCCAAWALSMNITSVWLWQLNNYFQITLFLKIWIKFFTWGLLKRVATGNV
jgi:hypothetical protein